MTAYEYLCSVQRFLPASREVKNLGGLVGKSEIKRWLENKAVLINGRRPAWKDMISFPIFELVFFPNSPSRTTYIQDWSVDREENILLETRLDKEWEEANPDKINPLILNMPEWPDGWYDWAVNV